MENNKNYDVNYFIKKFEAIPEDKWCTGACNKIIKTVKRKKVLLIFNKEEINTIDTYCAIGHCGARNGKSITSNKEVYALLHLKNHLSIGCFPVTEINDRYYPQYKQATPKQRVLAALYDVKKYQESLIQPKETIKYVTVEVDKQIKELSKEELVLN